MTAKLAIKKQHDKTALFGRIPRGNSGDLGAGFTNRRRRKRWFSRKYFASVMNIQEFFADNLGRDCCLAIANALNPDVMRRSVSL